MMGDSSDDEKEMQETPATTNTSSLDMFRQNNESSNSVLNSPRTKVKVFLN